MLERIKTYLQKLIGSPEKPDSFFVVPSGFQLRVLEPTDGRIAMPVGWFYSSAGTQSGWLWTISKQDPAAGAYETGFRIQMLLGIRAGGKGSPRQFVENVIQQKRSSAEVLSECAPEVQGDFVRQGIEVLESRDPTGAQRAYHLWYSLFSHQSADMVIVTTFGAPAETWSEVSHIVEIMSRVQVIGPKFRF